MNRWFRHYVGMMRDEKLVRAAVQSKQTVERVLWVWGAILESASEINDGGRYEFDVSEAAEFLDAAAGDLARIEGALAALGLVYQGCVVWPRLVCGEDRERPATHIWRRLRDFVFRRDDFTCRYCGAKGGPLECDHVVPVARGGDHELSNLVTACFPCNRSKRDKLLTEWKR